MITAAELAQIPVFAGLDESERQRLALKAADIRLERGDWLILEGEDPRFFVVLEGLLQAVKDIVGQRRELDQVKAGEFLGRFQFSWARLISSPCTQYLDAGWPVSIASSFRS